METRDSRGMEGSSKPETKPPVLGRMSSKSGPLRSDPHSHTDSFLTAARLLRGGWTEEGKKTRWHFSHLDSSSRQTPHSKSDVNQGPKLAEVCLKDPRSRRIPDVNSRRTTEDRETCSEKKADEAKQTTEGVFSANRQRERQVGSHSQAGVICVWASGCRTTYRQSRRFKAPILPVIAEM